MKIKATFLIPPVLDGTGNVDRWIGCNYCFYFLPVPAILYSATLLKDEADKVVIADMAAEGKTKKDFEAFISSDDSDVYLFYTVFLSRKTDLLARDMLRKTRRGAKFIFFGPHPTLEPGLFLDSPDTFVVRGEPEFILKETFRALASGRLPDDVKGLSYLNGGHIVNNDPAPLVSNIDDIPMPDRRLLDHRPYRNPKLHASPHTSMLTSRGCYGRCWFCVPNSLSYSRELEYKKGHSGKPPPRVHSAKRVIEEFNDIAALGFKSVSILDDEFLWDEARTLEICDGIKGLGLEWSCLARPDMVTEPAARSMARAGCVYVDLGTESFDPGILNAIKKEMTPADTENAFSVLKKHKIQVELNVLFGATPEETKETMTKTLAAVKRLNPDYVLFSVANPYPGTEFYEAAKKEGWLVYGGYVPVDSAKSSIISYPHLTKDELEKFISHAYLSYYYLNPRYLLRQLFSVKSPSDFLGKMAAAGNFFFKNFIKRKANHS